MKVTSAGQVSVPAEVRRRWSTSRVKVTDQGDRLIIEPEPENPFALLSGIFSGSGPSVDEMLAEARAEEQAAEERKFGS